MVPPVAPSPLPLILAVRIPREETIGPTIKVVLSPIPPVECLSTLMPGIELKSSKSPLWAMAMVSLAVSLSDMPFKQTAMRKADI